MKGVLPCQVLLLGKLDEAARCFKLAFTSEFHASSSYPNNPAMLNICRSKYICFVHFTALPLVI